MLNQEKIDQIKALRQSGQGHRQIALKIGCSPGTVVKYLKEDSSPSQNLPAVVEKPKLIEIDPDDNIEVDAQAELVELCGGPIDYIIMEFQNSFLSTVRARMEDPYSEPLTVDDLDLAVKDLRYDLENMDHLVLERLVSINIDFNFRDKFVYQKLWDKIWAALNAKEMNRLYGGDPYDPNYCD